MPPARTAAEQVAGSHAAYALLDHRNSAVDDPCEIEGALPLDMLVALIPVLEQSTETGRPCHLFVWEGYGTLPPEWSAAPKVRRPARRYLAFACLLGDIVEFVQTLPHVPDIRRGDRTAQASLDAELSLIRSGGDLNTVAHGDPTPGLWLPANARWCVATDVDSTITIVGGQKDLIEMLVEHPQLRAEPVAPDTVLW